jgi:hypothetical protein
MSDVAEKHGPRVPVRQREQRCIGSGTHDESRDLFLQQSPVNPESFAVCARSEQSGHWSSQADFYKLTYTRIRFVSTEWPDLPDFRSVPNLRNKGG